jgi:Glycosyl transferase family 2
MKVSIITTCRNAEAYIAEAAASVRDQTYQDIEHVITDAASSDSTVAVIHQQPGRDGFSLRLDSRPDSGVYEGLNRAIVMATGDIIGICNADDLMLPHVGMVTTGVAYFEQEAITNLRIATPSAKMTQEGLAFGLPAINGRYFKRTMFDRHGLFDTSLPLAGDRLWLMRAQQRGIDEAVLSMLTYRYRMHSGSLSMNGSLEGRQTLRREHLAMTRHLLATGAGYEMWAVCQKFRALEGIKMTWEGAPKDVVFKDLAELDGSWKYNALKAIRPWLRWRGQHAN